MPFESFFVAPARDTSKMLPDRQPFRPSIPPKSHRDESPAVS